MTNNCLGWKKDERVSGFQPAKDHPNSCFGCDGLIHDTYEGWSCKKPYDQEFIPYPELKEEEK